MNPQTTTTTQPKPSHTPYPYQLQGRDNPEEAWQNGGYCKTAQEAISALELRLREYSQAQWRIVATSDDTLPALLAENAALREALEEACYERDRLMDEVSRYKAALRAQG